jgi:hypothetical protein
LVEARLSISFAGGGRRGHVWLKVPSCIDIHAGVNEGLVERLLDHVGIRGAFGPGDERRDLWSLYPWRMTEETWRQQVGADFDRLIRQKTLRPVHLQTTTHPDHPAAGGALTVEAVDPTTIVGVSDDPAIGLRTLTSSDFSGYELDVAHVARELVTALELDGSSGEIVNGIWSLGRRSLSSSVSLAVVLASRRPSEDTAPLIREAGKGATHVVLLVPLGCSSGLDVSQIECRLPTGTHVALLGKIIEQLGLQGEVSPAVWLREDLLLDQSRGSAWFRGLELSKLRANTHPFAFAMAVARAQGRVVKKDDLNALLSPARGDEDVAKKAKADFIAAIKASFEAAGRDCPTDVATIFVARAGGYALNASARVL